MTVMPWLTVMCLPNALYRTSVITAKHTQKILIFSNIQWKGAHLTSVSSNFIRMQNLSLKVGSYSQLIKKYPTMKIGPYRCVSKSLTMDPPTIPNQFNLLHIFTCYFSNNSFSIILPMHLSLQEVSSYNI
jgi:hypothetical protein